MTSSLGANSQIITKLDQRVQFSSQQILVISLSQLLGWMWKYCQLLENDNSWWDAQKCEIILGCRVYADPNNDPSKLT